MENRNTTYEILDEAGNSIGEIRETEPSSCGDGCCFGGLLGIGIIVCILVAWPIVIYMIFSGDLATDDMISMLATVISIIVDIVIHGVILSKGKKLRFSKIWGNLLLTSTLIPWLISIVVSTAVGMEDIFLPSLIVTVMLATGASIIGAGIITLLRDHAD